MTRTSPPSWDVQDPDPLLQALGLQQVGLEAPSLELPTAVEEPADGDGAAHDRDRAFHDAAPVPHVTIRRDGVIVEVNGAAELMLGADQARLRGAPLDGFVDGFSRRAFRAFIHDLFANGRVRSPDLRIVREGAASDAPASHVLIDGVVVDAGDEAERCLLTIIDITDRKGLETARRRAQDEVLAIVSHDLRGPLNTIVLACDALRSSPGPSERDDCIAQIERAALRSVRLIKDLLGVVHIESGELRLERSRFDLGELAQQLCSDYRQVASNAGCRLTYAVGDGDLAVLADRDRLHQVGANLITNALVHARGAAVEVSAVAVGDGVMFAVTDQGPGIPVEDQPRVFDRFRKAGRARDGAGLGLTIVKGLVAAHGGTITLISSPGQGARFEILLPHSSL